MEWDCALSSAKLKKRDHRLLLLPLKTKLNKLLLKVKLLRKKK